VDEGLLLTGVEVKAVDVEVGVDGQPVTDARSFSAPVLIASWVHTRRVERSTSIGVGDEACLGLLQDKVARQARGASVL